MNPRYRLERIKLLIREGQYRITTSALQSANALGFDDLDICDCVLNWLDDSHFYKSMPAEKVSGVVARRVSGWLSGNSGVPEIANYLCRPVRGGIVQGG